MQTHTRPLRSEHSANLALHPDTVQAMRNLSALQRMKRDGWTVGHTFTRPAPIRVRIVSF